MRTHTKSSGGAAIAPQKSGTPTSETSSKNGLGLTSLLALYPPFRVYLTPLLPRMPGGYAMYKLGISGSAIGKRETDSEVVTYFGCNGSQLCDISSTLPNVGDVLSQMPRALEAALEAALRSYCVRESVRTVANESLNGYTETYCLPATVVELIHRIFANLRQWLKLANVEDFRRIRDDVGVTNFAASFVNRYFSDFELPPPLTTTRFLMNLFVDQYALPGLPRTLEGFVLADSELLVGNTFAAELFFLMHAAESEVEVGVRKQELEKTKGIVGFASNVRNVILDATSNTLTQLTERDLIKRLISLLTLLEPLANDFWLKHTPIGVVAENIAAFLFKEHVKRLWNLTAGEAAIPLAPAKSKANRKVGAPAVLPLAPCDAESQLSQSPRRAKGVRASLLATLASRASSGYGSSIPMARAPLPPRMSDGALLPRALAGLRVSCDASMSSPARCSGGAPLAARACAARCSGGALRASATSGGALLAARAAPPLARMHVLF